MNATEALEYIKTDGDWGEVFGESTYHDNCSQDVEWVLDGGKAEPVNRQEIKRVLWHHDGENDGEHWSGLFEMEDGRFLHANGGCDYTGWD